LKLAVDTMRIVVVHQNFHVPMTLDQR